MCCTCMYVPIASGKATNLHTVMDQAEGKAIERRATATVSNWYLFMHVCFLQKFA